MNDTVKLPTNFSPSNMLSFDLETTAANPFEAHRGCLKHLFPKGTRTDDLIREMRGC